MGESDIHHSSLLKQLEIVQYWTRLNPPLLATPAMGKIIQARFNPGSVLEMKVDNRYKDGNIKLVKGVVRGNSNTISLDHLAYTTLST